MKRKILVKMQKGRFGDLLCFKKWVFRGVFQIKNMLSGTKTTFTRICFFLLCVPHVLQNYFRLTMLNIQSHSFYAGATWKWTESLADYPASVWSLKMILKLPENNAVLIDAAATGDVHTFTYAAASSALLKSGNYYYQGVATHRESGEVVIVGEGMIVVNALLSALNADPRGFWEGRVADLEAAYTVAAKNGWAEMEADGILVKYSRADLFRELAVARYNMELEQRTAKGLSTIKRTYIRFGGN